MRHCHERQRAGGLHARTPYLGMQVEVVKQFKKGQLPRKKVLWMPEDGRGLWARRVAAHFDLDVPNANALVSVDQIP